MRHIALFFALSTSSTACINLESLRAPGPEAVHPPMAAGRDPAPRVSSRRARSQGSPAFDQTAVPPAGDSDLALQVAAGVALAVGVFLYVD